MGAAPDSSAADLRLLEEGRTPSASDYGTVHNLDSARPSGPYIYPDAPAGYRLHSISALWAAGYKHPADLQALSSDSLRDYYQTQNTLLHRYAQAAQQHPAPCVSHEDWHFLRSRHPVPDNTSAKSSHDTSVKRAIFASNLCNVGLMFAQLYAFASSGSLSLLAVFLDAFLDTVSGLVVLFTWYMKTKRDKHRYPVGRSRLEPLGVIGMACLMTAATLLTLEQSFTALICGQQNTGFSGLSVVSGSILLSALAVKLGLYAFCVRIDHASVQALAEDHFNDCLSNSVSFCTVLLAQHYIWWVDPLGGICISCLIIRNWISHTLEHFDQLLGRAAGPETLNVLTFMACNHHPDVRHIDTVRGYHVGNGLYVEVDIVLPANMPVHRAHDIGESLQNRIEHLDDVERCFVHIDTETGHSPDSEHKTV